MQVLREARVSAEAHLTVVRSRNTKSTSAALDLFTWYVHGVHSQNQASLAITGATGLPHKASQELRS